MNDYFYGWYYRFQGKNGSAALIPAVHLSEKERSCSIQVITEKESLYREFPIGQFRIDRKKERMQIGENLFSRKGICLDFLGDRIEKAGREGEGSSLKNTSPARMQVSGRLRFGKFTVPDYDIMGPFSMIPGMECRHEVYSMKHTVNGRLKLDQTVLDFQEAMGYMEGDSGNSFPEKYIWTQHFLPQGSLMLAAADIPLAGIHFTGTVGILFFRNREYRFATYLGASVRKMGEGELLIRQGHWQLQVRFPNPGGSLLHAPDCGQMVRTIRESVACEAEYTLLYRNRVLLHVKTDRAAAEYEV